MAVYKNRDIQMAARTPYHHNNKQTNEYHYPLHEINQSKRNESSQKEKEKKEPIKSQSYITYKHITMEWT